MAGTADRFYVRKTTGDLVGPLSVAAITSLVQQGQLDGSAEISADRTRWQPIARVIPVTPPAVEKGSAKDPATEGGGFGERDLGEGGDLELAPLDMALGGQPWQTAAPDPSPATSNDKAAPPGLAPVDLSTLAPLELDESKPVEVAQAGGQEPAKAAGEPASGAAGDESLPVDLAPAPPASGEADVDRPPTSEPLTGFQLSPLIGEAGRSPAAPAGPQIAAAPAKGKGGPTGKSAAAPATAGAQATATIAGTPATATAESNANASAAGGVALEPPAGTTAAAPIGRGRTLTAARPRPSEPPRRSRKPLLIGAAVAVLLLGGGAAFFAFDLGELIVREPAPEAVLGAVTAELASDQAAAYQRAATTLLDEVGRRPKSTWLRAAAAERLASSVVLHRADRGRTARAEATLAELPARPAPRPSAAATLVRARAWIALAKGRTRDAARTLDEAGGEARAGADGALLAGWIQIGMRKPAEAVATFRQAAAQFPERVALRYGLGRAQEESGDAATAAATYKQVLAASSGHFGAALGLIRTGHYPAPARLALASKLITDNHGASPAEIAEGHAIIARALAASGKSTESAAALEAALAKDPASPAALVAAGEALLGQGRLPEAVARFKLAVPGAPNVPAAVPARDLRFALAAVLIEGGNRADGLAALGPPPVKGKEVGGSKDGGAGDGEPRASFWRGRAAELQTPPDLAAATRAYEETLAVDPRFVPASLQLGALLMKQNRTADAVAVLKRAQTTGVAPATLQVALGQALLGAGDVERARKTFKDVLAQSPKDAPARLGLAAALEAARDRAGARRELEALLADSPELPGLRPRLAELLVAAGDRDKATALYQAELDSGKASLGTRLAAAKLAFEMGRRPAAQALLEKLVAEAPQTPGALLWLGKVRLAAGDVAGALSELRRALSFESTPELHFENGRALSAGGSEEKALSEYEQAVGIPAALVARGKIMLGRGDTEHSVPLLETALKQAPDDNEGWLLLGNGYDRMGAGARAVTAWRQAARVTPDSAEVHYHLGRWEMDQGQPGAALTHLRLAAARAPATARWLTDLYFQLGFAEKAKGARPAAAAALKKYLTLAPADAPSRAEVERQLAALGAAP